MFPMLLCRRFRRNSISAYLRHSRLLHSQPLTTIEHPLSYPIYTIWGANTSLGKTLVSAGLSMSFLSSANAKKFVYLKPIQTGFPEDSDSRFVYSRFSDFFLRNRTPHSVFASNHVIKASIPAAQALFENGTLGGGLESRNVGVRVEDGKLSGVFENLEWYEERILQGTENGEASGVNSQLICKTMYGWREAVSPHLAAERDGARVEDSELLEVLKRGLDIGLQSGVEVSDSEDISVMCVIETAGGVASPGPSGTLQCDLFRPFRLPTILVGDGRLGGVSGTISAYESLKLRGYDVVSVILEDHGLVNQVPLSSYFRNRIPVLVLPPVPQDMSDNLHEWFEKSQSVICLLKEIMVDTFLKRVQRLRDMPKRACDIVWWPFTQHELVPEEKVTLIDSRCGENFAVYKGCGSHIISQQFDACASWWTQGPNATLQIELARTIGYAAGRYGHVMFPENVYEPVLECTEILLEGVGKGWATRAYFSDNGSTAVEIALKMAFRKVLFDYGLDFSHPKVDCAAKEINLKVLALTGSYHGDTLGAMEAQSPSSYTGLFQQPWYSGRGFFLDPPKVFMRDGTWKLSFPGKIESERALVEDVLFSSRDEVFEQRRDASTISNLYLSYISEELSDADSRGYLIGALIIEPIIQGSGGMEMIDPLFQRILVKECQRRKIPVIFDEVFTGFWRLGAESAAKLLCCMPDISCFAKLMTGGTVPLAATLASDAIFKAFVGDSKLKALLHGHSYSAHAIGCSAAVESIKWFKNSETNINLIEGAELLRELWDHELVCEISSHQAVQRVVTLGTLCAVELRAHGCNAGYGSVYASSLIEKLREDGIYTRPLGNVIYLMCGPCTPPGVCSHMLRKVVTRLDDFSCANASQQMAPNQEPAVMIS